MRIPSNIVLKWQGVMDGQDEDIMTGCHGSRLGLHKAFGHDILREQIL
jgi:hypothetical protein